MPNARRHVTPAGTDQSVSRATIFETFGNSIRDVVPVANLTERAQLVADLTAVGQGPSQARPLVVHRADAPGLHRVEVTVDGSLWLPTSGRLVFPDRDSAVAWATANGTLLVPGDVAIIAGVPAPWTGTDWGYYPWTNLTATNGWSADTAENARPQISREGFRVEYRGRLFNGTPGSFAATLPGWARPSRQIKIPVTNNTGVAATDAWVQIDTNGSFRPGAWLSGESYATWTVR